MGDRLIRSETLMDMAGAIRLKTDTAETMSPGQMAEKILLAGFGSVPGYHDLEAMAVMEKIRQVRSSGSNVLVFGAMADSHVHVGTQYEALTKVSARHGGFALETVGRWAGCNFLANLGDNCWGGDLDTPEDFAAARYLNGCVAAGFGHLRSYRLVGECDRSTNPKKLYALNGIHNAFEVSAATAHRDFGYTDYPTRKVRLIVLNTSDCQGADPGFGMSYEQKAFLMHALDLSGKADCGQWQILILSHYPLDYPSDIRYNTAADVDAILSAYLSGGTANISVQAAYAAAEEEDPSAFGVYSGGALVYDYAGKNSARIIANIHGHVHNNCYGFLTGSGLRRVATPNACFYQNDKYSTGIYGTDMAYPKTENTSQDTAVTFYALDLDNRVIHSIAYGAGADRVISY